ncbi:DUF6480 family protein [Streptomyces avermitilis]|uniref:DUF6480 family protein n=1 Tax=Streptomyces avermitilis TaxID=33903 RepID=UPI0033DB869F
MTTPDPHPRRAPGVAPGGVSPGDTPPAEGGTYGISYPVPELRKGWGAMPLTLIMVVVALIAIGLIAMVAALIA